MKPTRKELIIRGELIPQTEEEVLLFEKHNDLSNIKIPKSLEDPYKVWDRRQEKKAEEV